MPDLPGCIAASEIEARELFHEAIQLNLDDLQVGGESVPDPVLNSALD